MGHRRRGRGYPRAPNDDAGRDQAPVKLLELELSEPLPAIRLDADGGRRRYSRALCLVRIHGYPLGFAWLATDQPAGLELAAEQVRRQIWDQLGAEILEHLHRDGLTECAAPVGDQGVGGAACTALRDAVRRYAPPATVVIATRDRPDSLRRCLDALLALDYPDFELMVVDNAPRSSATRELIRSPAYRVHVNYVREDTPGLAAAHNRGLREASGRFVAFTDDDVVVDRLWLLELARGFQLARHVGCVTGLIVPIELETPAQLLAEHFWALSKGFHERVFDLTTDDGDPLYPYTAGSFGSGANMAFDLDALRGLGGFDPATGAGTPARGGDDLASFFSVVSAGWRLVYNPAAIVRHAHLGDFGALRRQAYGYGVALTAYLTKAMIDRPSRLPRLFRQTGAGVARARNPRSPRSAGTLSESEAERAAELAWAERWGMLCGPVAYLRSRRRARGNASGRLFEDAAR